MHTTACSGGVLMCMASIQHSQQPGRQAGTGKTIIAHVNALCYALTFSHDSLKSGFPISSPLISTGYWGEVQNGV